MTRQSAWIWFLFGLCGTAFGQTIPNGNIPLSSGQVWTLPQWNTAWQAKVDVTNGTATGLSLSGPTLSGTVAGTPTFSGVVTLNGGGTGLSVANNATISGTLTTNNIASTATTLNLNTTNGQGLQIFSNAAVANRPSIQTGNTATTPAVLTTSGAGGFQFSSYLNVTRGSIAYSGTTSGTANHLLDSNVTLTGSSSDTGQYSINNHNGFMQLQSAYPLQWNSSALNLQAGFYGQANTGLWATTQTGTPGTLAVWAPNTAYATLGGLVQNGTNEYQLITAGTSASSGGPTGTGTNITDGTAQWRYISVVDLSYNMSGPIFQSNAAFNVGGSLNDFRGVVQGSNDVAQLGPSATSYLNLVGREIDVGIQTGGSAYRRVALQLVSIFQGQQGLFQDAGLTFGGDTSGRFVNGINFADNSVSAADGYAINFWPWNTGGSLPMAGGLDMLRVNANGSGKAGGGFLARWANGQITNPTGQTAGGDLYLGYASLHVTSTGATLDASLYMLTGNPTGITGGTNWSTGQYAVDNHGNRGTVTASAGIPSAVTITQFASSSAPYTTSTWSPDNASSNLGAGGSPVISTSFTATEATAQVSGATITLGGVATVAFGNAMAKKNTVVASLPTCNSGSKYYEYVVSDASAPTYGSTVVGSGGVVTPVICDGTNWKAH